MSAARSLVLGCHRVVASGPLKCGVDVSIEWLRDVVKLPYRFCTVEELLRKPNEDALVLTFDDGDPTVETHALPLLAEFGIRASAFVMVRVGGAAPAFWSDLIAAGWEISSHSLTHPTLDLLDAHNSRSEIREIKLRSRICCGYQSVASLFHMVASGEGKSISCAKLAMITRLRRSHGFRSAAASDWFRGTCVRSAHRRRKSDLWQTGWRARFKLSLSDEAVYRI